MAAAPSRLDNTLFCPNIDIIQGQKIPCPERIGDIHPGKKYLEGNSLQEEEGDSQRKREGCFFLSFFFFFSLL